MAASNKQRVERALEMLVAGMRPFVQRELEAVYRDRWQDEVVSVVRMGPDDARSFSLEDVAFLLKIMQVMWNDVFKRTLGRSERTYVNELIDVRNKWAHEGSSAFSTDDAYRAMDTAQRLLTAIAAPQAAEVEKQKYELQRIRFEEQTRRETQEVKAVLFEADSASGLKPWREVVSPHRDVANGRYAQAEFAADLGQVYRGEGVDEYRDPQEFFRRTFVTEGLRHLLIDAAQRLAGSGGVPIRDLQTNFGGGKTHSLLALYHLFSGTDSAALSGVDAVLRDADVEELPHVNRAVLVGTAMSPGQPETKPDGIQVNTLWGELAWQLGAAAGDAAEAYAMVAEADRSGTSPGIALNELLAAHAPCLILIDEWVAYARGLYGKDELPGGTFDTHFTFAQALTEAVRAVPKTLLVVSIPASDSLKKGGDGSGAWDVEIGGEGGQAALDRLRRVIGRMESPWRPATAEESFEIVRRRLFEEIVGQDAHQARDTVARLFSEFYRGQAQEFPSGCGETVYEKRVKAAYPIHPELFDRLYEDWSTLARFQRTRGVLRLMAAVIHTLWETGDKSPLIMPASLPMDAESVSFELTRYLEDNWKPVIETDVDGPHSLPMRLERELSNTPIGRHSACRRVARTVFLGSAPTLQSANRGIDDRRINLGCALPGESPSVFGDALRRLSDQATHLYVDAGRYWLDTQPSVAQLARDRAAQRSEDEVSIELVKQLRAHTRRGDFAAVHTAPSTSSEVPDEDRVRLVVLGPNHSHSSKTEDSPARSTCADILDNRGSGRRTYRNMLAFLAPDRTRLEELNQAIRQYLSWASIVDARVELNLHEFSAKQAITKRDQALETVKQRVLETYCWLLVPTQTDLQGAVTWDEARLQGQDQLAVRASRRMTNDQSLITQFGAVLLKRELDRIPLWREGGDESERAHVSTRQLWEDFATYPYLPRLRDSQVLIQAIHDGILSTSWQADTFAYASGVDVASGRYQELAAGHGAPAVHLDGSAVLVRPTVAAAQFEAERLEREKTGGGSTEGAGTGGTTPGPEGGEGVSTGGGEPDGGTTTATAVARRFHGVVEVDPERINRDAGSIADNVVQHLTKLPGASVHVTIEVHAVVPDGAPDDVVRTVNENARTLKFQDFGFDEE